MICLAFITGIIVGVLASMIWAYRAMEPHV